MSSSNSYVLLEPVYDILATDDWLTRASAVFAAHLKKRTALRTPGIRDQGTGDRVERTHYYHRKRLYTRTSTSSDAEVLALREAMYFRVGALSPGQTSLK